MQQVFLFARSFNVCESNPAYRFIFPFFRMLPLSQISFLSVFLLRRPISPSLALSQPPSLSLPPPRLACFFFSLCGIQRGCKCIFLSGVHSAERPAWALYARAGWRRMVMTVAFWDHKRVKFKRSQHIRAPVNQAGPSARVSASARVFSRRVRLQLPAL